MNLPRKYGYGLTIKIFDYLHLHIPGKFNCDADYESRHFKMEHEWMLDEKVVKMAIKELRFEPEYDLFATRINRQFEKYIYWKPEPESFAIDAFSLSWTNMKCYCFPPFSVLPAVLQKMAVEKVTGIVILPNWPTQHYYSTAMNMLIAQPLYVLHKRKTLQIPNSTQIHKIWDKLDLVICILSGDQSKI